MKTLKYSRQREAIKEFLIHRTDHPTADTIYDQIRETYPNISMGTVYRNLALLEKIGEIKKITTGAGAADHFDGNITPHNHFVCTTCHRVMDLEMDNIDFIKETAAKNFPGTIDNYITHFYGTCKDCIPKS